MSQTRIALGQHVLGLAGTRSNIVGDSAVGPEQFAEAERTGRLAEGVPLNHSPAFAPDIRSILDTGTRALVVAAPAHLS